MCAAILIPHKGETKEEKKKKKGDVETRRCNFFFEKKEKAFIDSDFPFGISSHGEKKKGRKKKKRGKRGAVPQWRERSHFSREEGDKGKE